MKTRVKKTSQTSSTRKIKVLVRRREYCKINGDNYVKGNIWGNY